MKFLLKFYLWIHEIVHKRVISRLGIAVYGFHPKEVFGKRFEFFLNNVNSNDVVIDIACGTGTILYMIKDGIKFGFGIDNSQKQIYFCNKFRYGNNINYLCADVLGLNYDEIRKKVNYNVAIFSHFLEHVDDVVGLLNKVNADKILICVPSEDNWYRLLMKNIGLDIRTDRSHIKEYNKNILVRELKSANYEIIIMEYNSDGDIVCVAKKINII